MRYTSKMAPSRGEWLQGSLKGLKSNDFSIPNEFGSFLETLFLTLPPPFQSNPPPPPPPPPHSPRYRGM